MFVWWRNVLCESTLEGHHTEAVMLFFALFWAFSHSILAPTIKIGGIWPPKGIKVLDPWKIPFLNTLIPPSSGAAITWAHHAILAGKEKRAVYALVATVSLALYLWFLSKWFSWFLYDYRYSFLDHMDRRDYGRSCSARNDPKLDLGLFEIVHFNRNQRCFLVSRFFSKQIEEPNGSNK
ncbi:hypothetical protein M9H77_36283 [Catharanthus roseus]|uniref:Uncharacterized protein n=1 Tax=Catharanthus roseus TaxID=4058 RepID=A0ACB9ZS69_CATRO|nr:hypothetical protein M9H77_36283 [Catharanthus roseus]